MKKYLVVALVGCVAISVIAKDKDYNLRTQVCDDYWKKIIADIKETRNALQAEWDSLAPWEHQGNQRLFDMLCRVQNQHLSAQDARNLCFEIGLEKSKESYENRW